MKTTLILADIHHKVDQADKIIKYVDADEVILIGDLFDDFDDTATMVEKSAKWFINFVNQPNHIFITGNHDIQYAYPYSTFRCSGYENWKYMLINDIVSKKDWDKLKWYHILDNRWLLTHAGLHNSNLPSSIKNLRNNRPKFFAAIGEYLDNSIIDGLRAAANNNGSWIFNAGASRGGFNKVGGITWCDHTMEFSPIEGLSQIYGHTSIPIYPTWCSLTKDKRKSYVNFDQIIPSPEILDNPNNSINLDLDVHGNIHYGIWDGKTLTVGNYRDL